MTIFAISICDFISSNFFDDSDIVYILTSLENEYTNKVLWYHYGYVCLDRVIID